MPPRGGHGPRQAGRPGAGHAALHARRRAPSIVCKVLESAIANAENNNNADIDTLKVERIEVNEAPTLKRFHARAKGRGNRIVKRNSHIMILVGDGRQD